MDADDQNFEKSTTKYIFKPIDSENKAKLLQGKDKASTQRATKSYIDQFNGFLAMNKLPNVDAIPVEDLDNILSDFYSSVRPQKKDDYSVQTLKCLRSGLNRYFRKMRGIDITTDNKFVKANEMFEAVKVNAKKEGRGVKKSTPPITPIDLERIAEYFCYDHVSKPDPRRLLQNMLFYIVYFFCRRGRENLYSMTQQTFKHVVEADGTEYFVQDIDEMDKNHGADDSQRTNEGCMYATNSKFTDKYELFFSKLKSVRNK